MRLWRLTLWVALGMTAAKPLQLSADLAKARAETKMDRRASLALDNAEAQLSAAAQAYRRGEWEKTLAALEEVRESVELAQESLAASGRDPRRSTPHKRLEIRTRKLLRTLTDLRERMSVDERPQIDSVIAVVQKVHEETLDAVMGGALKKKR